MNPERTLKLIGIFDTLSKANEETTRIVPNLPVIDAAPTDLGSKYIIVRNELGYNMPAVKTPGIAFQVGDFVNVLYMKGTEPVAFQVGSSNPDPRWDLYLDDLLDVNAEDPGNNYFLKWDQTTSYWIPAPAGSGFALSDLADVSLAGLTDEDVLQYDSTNSYWWNAPAPSGLPFDVLTCDLVNPDADYSTFTDLNTALSTGDTAVIGPGLYDHDNLTLKAANYIGFGIDNTIIFSDYAAGTVISAPDDCVIENMTLEHDYSSASSRTYIGFTGTGTLTFRNVKIKNTNAGGGSTLTLAVTGGGTVVFENVTIEADGGTAITYALYIFNSSTVIAYDSVIGATSSSGYTGGNPYARAVGLLDSGSVYNGYDTHIKNGFIWRSGDFSPANIISSWAAEPPAQDNPIINGGMEIWQRGTSFAAAASGDFAADRFRYNKTGAMVHTLSQSSDVPTVAQAGILFNYSTLIDCTTIDSSLAGTDYTSYQQVIEGYNWTKFAQEPFWLSFWVKATKTGTYCVSFHNEFAPDRSFVAEYTVSATDTWEYKEIYVPASPSAGTWDYTTGSGLHIRWMLAAGATWQTTAWTWQTGHYYATANQVNACDSTSNNFRLTGVMMSKYRSPFWQPDYEMEMERCQRYYQKSYEYSTVPGTVTVNGMEFMETRTAVAGSVAGFVFRSTRLLQRMRPGPTITLYSPSTGTANAIRNFSTAADRTGCTAGGAMETGFHNVTIDNTSANAIALDNRLAWHWVAESEL